MEGRERKEIERKRKRKRNREKERERERKRGTHRLKSFPFPPMADKRASGEGDGALSIFGLISRFCGFGELDSRIEGEGERERE